MKWLLILITVFASSCGDLLCASGMSEGAEIQDLRPSGIVRAIRFIVTRRKVILGGLCYASAFLSLLGLLSIAPLSVAVPATALGFVIDTVGARFILHEHIPWKRWVGVLCVTAGVILTVGLPGASTGPAGSRGPAVQAHEHQPRYDQPRAQGLDPQRAAAKILAKPRRPEVRDGVRADENDRVAYAGNGLHHGRRSAADREDHQE
jgi:multidrug transporter EmrE-like cation transporter